MAPDTSKSRRSRRRFEDEFKAQAVRLVLDDGKSIAAVVGVIAIPGQWDEYMRLDAAERLLTAGVVLPRNVAFALVDGVVEQIEKWMQDSDKYLLRRVLALCPFIDDPMQGFAKMREVLAKRRLWAYELRELVTAIGESRSDAAVDLLYELASDAQTFEQCENNSSMHSQRSTRHARASS
jgi:hypothetical protein